MPAGSCVVEKLVGTAGNDCPEFQAKSWQYVSRSDELSSQILRESSNLSTSQVSRRLSHPVSCFAVLCKGFLFKVATLLSNISSSMALCTAMTETECEPWTKNEFLITYEKVTKVYLVVLFSFLLIEFVQGAPIPGGAAQ